MSAILNSEEALSQFAGLAEEYCSFFESWPARERDSFLREAHRRLPPLYAAALQLPDVYSEPPESIGEENEEEDDDYVVPSTPDPDLVPTE
ncbi:MAG: DUF5063 domain-containing protein, partial [Gemmatimonadetes bacterium]|nr:DUF5063 domain-containing protein [Gemmatimonadota bacterium]